MSKVYINYGCGLCAPESWLNFDASPTLKIQKIPIIGWFYRKKTVNFPVNARYGDIIKGLPSVKEKSCDGIYCSHVLEHLSLEDCRCALKNTYRILKKGGIFRVVVPDIEDYINIYLREKAQNNPDALYNLMSNTCLGIEQRKRGLQGLLASFLGNSNHLWMWDKQTLEIELKRAGFTKIRECKYNDCIDENFKTVENSKRFESSIAFECVK